MKTLVIKLYVTELLEQLTGLTFVPEDIDLGVRGTDLVIGKGVRAPIYPEHINCNTVCYKLASLKEDTIITYDDVENILLMSVEGIVFVGDSDKCEALAKYMGTGKFGLVAECVKVDGFRRGYWTTDDTTLWTKIVSYLKDGDEAKKPAKPAKKPKKSSAKPKPEKPADEPAPEPEAEKPADEPAPDPEVKKPAESAPAPEAEKPAEEPACDAADGGVRYKSLLEMFHESLETAEETCRRLCREEEIEYDLDSDEP